MHPWISCGFLFVSTLLPNPGPTPPALVFIDPAGSDATGDGTAGNPFRTPQKAINTVDPNGTIRVRPGAYPFQAVVTKAVRFEAAGPGASTFGPGPFPGDLMAVIADDVTFSGITFVGTSSDRAVHASGGADRLSLDSCTFSGFGASCVLIDGITTTGHLIQGCNFVGIHGPNGAGAVSLNGVLSSTINGCTFRDCDRGVELIGSVNPRVQNTTFTDLLQAAVVSSGSVNLVVEDVTATRCGHFTTPLNWAFPSDQLGTISVSAFSNNAQLRRLNIEDCGGYTGKNSFVGTAPVKYDGLFAVAIIDSNGTLLEDSSLHRNFFGGVHVSGLSAGTIIRRCNLVQNGERNSPGKDTALFAGVGVSAPNNFWGQPTGAAHDGPGFGNGIDGPGPVSVTPIATVPYPSGPSGFVTYPSVPAGSRPLSVALGDFTNDSRLDLVFVEDLSGSIAVARNLGGGTFAARTVTNTGGLPVALATGSFDSDGFLDVAVLDQLNDRVVVLFGDGTGSFTPAKTKLVSVSRRPVRLRVANLDGTDLDDIVVASEGDIFQAGGLQWLKNNGTGNFTRIVLAGTAVPTDVEVIDVNSDTRLDVVAFDRAQVGPPGLRVLTNLGGGLFTPTLSVPVDNHPIVEATLLRVNVDGGAEDIAVADYVFGVPPGVTNIQVFRGNGIGGFLPPVLLAQDVGPVTLRAGNFGGSSLRSLVAVNPGLAAVTVLGPVATAPSLYTPYASKVLSAQYSPDAATGDVTGDGITDMVIADGGANLIRVFRGEYPSSVTTFGTGCFGINGVPVFLSHSLPKIGSASFSIGFEKGNPNSAAAALIGASPANTPLPGGCSLLVNYVTVIYTSTNAAGQGALPLPVPLNPGFLGGGLTGQWFILDTSGQVLNIVSATNGFQIIVGG